MNMPDVTIPRLVAALAELNRQREQMAAHYPAMVHAGKLTAAEAETRIQAIADAAIVVAAALAAMEQRAAALAARVAAGTPKPQAPAGEPAEPATESSASVFRPLPYAQGETIEGRETEVVKCRFCGAACVRSLSKSLTVESWKCSLPKCVGSSGWVHRSKIEAPKVAP